MGDRATHTKQPFRRQVEGSSATEDSSSRRRSREQQAWLEYPAAIGSRAERQWIYFRFRSVGLPRGWDEPSAAELVRDP
jgi:hypothetical protein